MFVSPDPHASDIKHYIVVSQWSNMVCVISQDVIFCLFLCCLQTTLALQEVYLVTHQLQDTWPLRGNIFVEKNMW